MQAACIRQHSTSTVHRVAESHFLCPDRNVSELAPYNLQEQDLYRGNVPQANDWLRAWNSCQTAASFNKAQKHYETEDYAAGRPCSVSRKSILFPQSICICFGEIRFFSNVCIFFSVLLIMPLLLNHRHLLLVSFS